MPLVSKTNFNNCILYLWKIEESEKKLKEGIKIYNSLRKRLSIMKTEKHRKGILAVHQLLKLAKIPENNLLYDSKGAPYLKSKKFISISHTKYFAGIVIGEFPIGLDIEACHNKILNIGQKFLNPNESYAIGNIEESTYIWTSKEAIYKALRIPGINFSKQIRLKSPYIRGEKAEALAIIENKIKLFKIISFDVDSHFITIALENKLVS
tara:strand:+ start:16011 stop:16637 length:627 start_codon:yes stop_codon:yes gene_type:complete